MDASLVRSDGAAKKGSDSDDLMAVICDATVSGRTMDASLVRSDGAAKKGSDSDDLMAVICDATVSGSCDPDDVTIVICDATVSGSVALDELTEVITSEEFSTASTVLSELTTGMLDGPTTETKSILKQLSKLDNGVDDADILNSSSTIRRIVHLIVSSFTFRIFGILLIFVDVFLIVTDLLATDSTHSIPIEYRSISLAIAMYFLMEVCLRVFIDGIRPYFSDIFNFLDAAVIVVTLLVDIVYIFYDFKSLKDISKLTFFFRPLRLIILLRVFHLVHQKKHLEILARRVVSENKRRYKKNGFDLDLTYVTDRVIAMSFPSSGKQSLYRNPIEEVVRFLDTKHQNHYQVYNLCSENAYDPKNFHHRVQRYMIDDHNVPTLSEMLAFSKNVQEWMAQDEENVIAVHCKGGKGRTGTMICAYLLASEIFTTAEASCYYFGERRTDKSTSSKFQGIETPSQNRFVGYFAQVKNSFNMTLPLRKILTIKKIIIYSIHGVGTGNGNDLKVQIIMQQKTVFSGSASQNCRMVHDAETDRVIFNLLSCPPLYDEVKVKFLSSNLPKYYDNCPFFFWFHTSFIQNNRLYLPRSELDNPHKPRAWKIYRPDFAVEVHFDEVVAGI